MVHSQMSELQRSFIYYKNNPSDFFKDVLKANLTDQQQKVIDGLVDAINHRKGVSIRSGHGTGKSFLLAGLILWFISTRPHPKIIATAPTQHQLNDVLWSELALLNEKSLFKNFFTWTKTAFCLNESPESWFAVARSAARPENLQGFHAPYLMFIIDEASGVDPKILEVIEGTQTQEGCLIIMTGNPTRLNGGFYESFHSKRRFYKNYVFNSEESILVEKGYCENLAEKFGKDSDVYRIRVLGEFPKEEPDTLIPIHLCEAAAIREMDLPDISTYETVEIGVDVARFGDDETVIYSRVGNVIREEVILRNRDLMHVSGEIIKTIEKFAGKTAYVNIDESGLGSGVVDRVEEVVKSRQIRAVITGVNNGAKAKDDAFINTGSEMWFYMREKIKDIRIPNDNVLIGQLSSRKYRLSSSGKHMVEPKEQMKNRGLQSPDRADALVLCFRSFIYPKVDRRHITHVA